MSSNPVPWKAPLTTNSLTRRFRVSRAFESAQHTMVIGAFAMKFSRNVHAASLVLMSPLVTAWKRQGWILLPEGASRAASSNSSRTLGSTGSSLNLRMLLRCSMASFTCIAHSLPVIHPGLQILFRGHRLFGKFAAQDLANCGLGQLIHEFHFTRHLVRGHFLPAELDSFILR